jgi:Ca-activated chloride channel family protein
MAKKSKFFLLSGIIVLLVFTLVYLGVNLTSNLGKTKTQVNSEDASKQLSKLYSNISISTETPVKGQIDLNPADVAESLPDISKFPIAVDNTTDNFVEIFSSTEKSGTGVDGWLAEVATEFNKANINVNGKPASVKIRNIASGTAADYIKSGKYVPDAFTPSNELWGEMIKASGVKTQLVSKRLVGNVPGIVIAKQNTMP